MAINDYFSTWILQAYIRYPTGYPSPYEFAYKWGDSTEIQGLFVQNQSIEAIIAGAVGIETKGRFTVEFIPPKDGVDPNVPLKDGDVLRSGETYIKLIGEPVIAPEVADVKIKVFVAEYVNGPGDKA
jgi:hypothetical protein